MSNPPSVSLREVDRVEIVTLIDNYVDLLLPSTEMMTRPTPGRGGGVASDTLLAEHGLSLLISVWLGEDRHTILFDTGYSKIGVPHNLEQLGLDPSEIEAIVLSHGHMDHTGALLTLLDTIPGVVTLVFHPDVLLFPRYMRLEDGTKLPFPQALTRDDLISGNVEVLESKSPTILADHMVAVTGEVERTTKFEKSLPSALVERDGKLEQDPMLDDQALVINLKGKGLVVISGCSHSGIINTALFARELTGVERIYAVIGGFHLSGPAFEPIIEETLGELKNMAPEVIVPMHCTGWKAIQRISQEFPSSFLLNSVGSKINL